MHDVRYYFHVMVASIICNDVGGGLANVQTHLRAPSFMWRSHQLSVD